MIDLRFSDVADAIRLLTRFPFPAPARAPRGAEAAWAYPLAGLLVGLSAALAVALAAAGGMNSAIAAAFAIAATVVVTGALHEDGLADTADGLWGGHSRERRLEIMKDSRIGSYGVLALILSVLLRWTALTELVSAGNATGALIATAVLSRAAMAPAMNLVPFARANGLAVSVGTVATGTALLAVGIGAALSLIFAGSAALVAILATAIAGTALLRLAWIRIGGLTGDILGALQQVAEILTLCCFAALL